MVVAGGASDLNSLQSPSKVSLLTREQTPRLRTGINNVEYKCLCENAFVATDFVSFRITSSGWLDRTMHALKVTQFLVQNHATTASLVSKACDYLYSIA